MVLGVEEAIGYIKVVVVPKVIKHLQAKQVLQIPMLHSIYKRLVAFNTNA
jgi:hypothetical protein